MLRLQIRIIFSNFAAEFRNLWRDMQSVTLRVMLTFQKRN